MNITILFIGITLLVFVLAWGIFDVWVILKKGKQESISAHIIRGGKKYPVMVFTFGLLLGILFGHLFWSMRSQDYLSKEDFSKECTEFLEDNRGKHDK